MLRRIGLFAISAAIFTGLFSAPAQAAVGLCGAATTSARHPNLQLLDLNLSSVTEPDGETGRRFVSAVRLADLTTLRSFFVTQVRARPGGLEKYLLTDTKLIMALSALQLDADHTFQEGFHILRSPLDINPSWTTIAVLRDMYDFLPRHYQNLLGSYEAFSADLKTDLWWQEPEKLANIIWLLQPKNIKKFNEMQRFQRLAHGWQTSRALPFKMAQIPSLQRTIFNFDFSHLFSGGPSADQFEGLISVLPEFLGAKVRNPELANAIQRAERDAFVTGRPTPELINYVLSHLVDYSNRRTWNLRSIAFFAYHEMHFPLYFLLNQQSDSSKAPAEALLKIMAEFARADAAGSRHLQPLLYHLDRAYPDLQVEITGSTPVTSALFSVPEARRIYAMPSFYESQR